MQGWKGLLSASLALLSACTAASQPAVPVQAETSGEIREREAIRGRVETALMKRDFAALNAMEQEFRTQRSRTSSGTWKLSWFYRSLPDATPRKDGTCVNEAEPILTKWREAYPAQPAPLIAQAQNLVSLAWCIRGNGSWHQVPKAAWPAFYRAIGTARQILEANHEIASVDPQYYAVMVDIYMAEGRSKAALQSLLDEATAREPLYYETYFGAAYYYLPQWHGDPGDLHRLGRYAVQRTRDTDGSGVYARLMWTLIGISGTDLGEMDWATAKRGMQDVMRAYPDEWNAAGFARLSCRMNDGKAAASFFASAPSDDGSAWGRHPEGVDEWKACRALAGVGQAPPPGSSPAQWRPERCAYAIVEVWPAEQFKKHCR